jgi:hypothetical protein
MSVTVIVEEDMYKIKGKTLVKNSCCALTTFVKKRGSIKRQTNKKKE